MTGQPQTSAFSEEQPLRGTKKTSLKDILMIAIPYIGKGEMKWKRPSKGWQKKYIRQKFESEERGSSYVGNYSVVS